MHTYIITLIGDSFKFESIDEERDMISRHIGEWREDVCFLHLTGNINISELNISHFYTTMDQLDILVKMKGSEKDCGAAVCILEENLKTIPSLFVSRKNRQAHMIN